MLIVYRVIFFKLILIVVFAGQVLGQYPVQIPPHIVKQDRRRKDHEARTKKRIRDSRNFRINRRNSGITGRNISRPFIFNPSYKPVKTKEIVKNLKVDTQDILKYDSFLKKTNTGIIKLLQSNSCHKIKRKKAKKCLKRRMNIERYANAYSFIQKDFVAFNEADFRYSNNKLLATAMDVQGILVDLGNSSISELGLKSDGISMLAGFEPASQLKKVQIQFKTLLNGIHYQNQFYSKSVPVKLNNTYVIRSIAYRTHGFITLENALDVIVVFRVIRKDIEGNITIIWKELFRKHSPSLNN